MVHEVTKWLDAVLHNGCGEDVAAFCFNLYEDEDDNWSMELIGAGHFDEEDDDWPCDEITDFGTREEMFAWEQEAEWDEILEEVCICIREYLEHGKYAEMLKHKAGIGVGFVDGDTKIIYSKS